MAAILTIATETEEEHRPVRIFIPLDTTIKLLTDKLTECKNTNWMGYGNWPLIRATVARLQTRKGLIILSIYNDNVDKQERERIKKITAKQSKDRIRVPLKLPTKIKKTTLIQGAKLSSLTQAKVYKHILEHKATNLKPRKQMSLHIRQVKETVLRRDGYTPSKGEIWKLIRSKDIVHQQTMAFLWKLMHGALPCGEIWMKNKKYTSRAVCPGCKTTESPHHMLLACEANRQNKIWKMTEKLLNKKGIKWKKLMNIGKILACRIPPRKSSPGEAHLTTIAVAEAAWLIWALRCKWIVGDKGKTDKKISSPEAENSWWKMINKHLNLDITASNEKRYKQRTIDADTGYETWENVVQDNNKLYESLDMHRNSGVLVSIGNNLGDESHPSPELESHTAGNTGVRNNGQYTLDFPVGDLINT